MAKRSYDWDRWFGRSRFVLTRGQEFRCSPLSMAQQVRNAASILGRSAVVRVDGDRVVVIVGEKPVKTRKPRRRKAVAAG